MEEAKEVDMYRMIGLYQGEKVVAVAGYKSMITLYYGLFVWICDLVTDELECSKAMAKSY